MGMVRVVYIGGYTDEVVVPDLGLRVKPGEPVEVSEAAAEGLLCQPEVWRRAEDGPPVKKQRGGEG